MTKNTKNSIKFTIAALAVFCFSYCIGQIDFEHPDPWYIAGTVIPILIFAGYIYHVFTDK